MTQTNARPMRGSLTNRILESAAPKAPAVGEGATEILYSDRHAATIVEVSASGRRVVVQRDRAIRTDGNGMSDAQAYRFEPNPTAARHAYTLRKNGRWIAEGESMGSGTILSIGRRSEYHDFSF